jgi:hypothetical protein
MNRKALLLTLALTVPGLADSLSVTADPVSGLDLAWRHSLASGPWYALGRAGGGHETQRSDWYATGAPWSPCWRQDRLRADELH